MVNAEVEISDALISTVYGPIFSKKCGIKIIHSKDRHAEKSGVVLYRPSASVSVALTLSLQCRLKRSHWTTLSTAVLANSQHWTALENWTALSTCKTLALDCTLVVLYECMNALCSQYRTPTYLLVEFIPTCYSPITRGHKLGQRIKSRSG